MLVIRRHPGEAIQIGEDVEVTVIDCGPGRVKLGIRAPKDIQVMRAEVKITREQNLAAARAIEVGRKTNWRPAGRRYYEKLPSVQGSPTCVDKQQ